MLIENRAAHYNYFVEETVECGIELRGNEVKSIRAGKASIREAWVTIENGEIVIKQMHITPWNTANAFDVDEKRTKKLLAHKFEIRKMYSTLKRDGMTLVPLKVYFSDKGKVKVLVGVCKGKKVYDKRETLKKEAIKRDAQRELASF